MSYIKYKGLQTKYQNVKVKPMGDNRILVTFPEGTPPVMKLVGFGYYLPSDELIGDYSDFKTQWDIYNPTVNGFILSNDGSTEPEPVPAPDPYVPTSEEIRIEELKIVISSNKAQLAESDYKVIKNSEYVEAGLELAYDAEALNAERQALRDAINAAETELAALTESEVS